MGEMFPPLYGKSKYFAKKREKALKKMAKQQLIVEICDKYLNENK